MFRNSYTESDFRKEKEYTFHLFSGKMVKGYVQKFSPGQNILVVSEKRSSFIEEGKISVIDLSRIEFFEGIGLIEDFEK